MKSHLLRRIEAAERLADAACLPDEKQVARAAFERMGIDLEALSYDELDRLDRLITGWPSDGWPIPTAAIYAGLDRRG